MLSAGVIASIADGAKRVIKVIAFALNVDTWKAETDCGDVIWTNENGEKFRLTVEQVEEGGA